MAEKSKNDCLIGQNIYVSIVSVSVLPHVLLVSHKISKANFSDLITKIKLIDWLHTDLFQVFITSKDNLKFSGSENSNIEENWECWNLMELKFDQLINCKQR